MVMMLKTMMMVTVENIHRIHNGAQNTRSRLDSLLLSFAGLRLSKAALWMSILGRTTSVEFEVAFAILQFFRRAIGTLMVVQPRSDVSSLDLMSPVSI